MEGRVLEKIEQSLEQLSKSMDDGFKAVDENFRVLNQRVTNMENELKGSEFGGEAGLSKRYIHHEERIKKLENQQIIDKAQRQLLIWLVTPLVSLFFSILSALAVYFITK